MVACLRLHRVIPKFNTIHLQNPAVVQQWENYLAGRTADIVNSSPENIDEDCSVIKNAFISGARRFLATP